MDTVPNRLSRAAPGEGRDPARSAGLRRIAGVDEVGRGPLAGPVVVAAVILNQTDMPEGIADSKTLAPARREAIAADILKRALAVSIASSCATTIDRINIRAATLAAMARAVRALELPPTGVLVDGRDVFPCDCPCEAIIKGDATEPAIAAASIVAKVARDRLMARLGLALPDYGFEDHAGYGTRRHLDAIETHGPSVHHRFSFAPIKGRWPRP